MCFTKGGLFIFFLTLSQWLVYLGVLAIAWFFPITDNLWISMLIPGLGFFCVQIVIFFILALIVGAQFLLEPSLFHNYWLWVFAVDPLCLPTESCDCTECLGGDESLAAFFILIIFVSLCVVTLSILISSFIVLEYFILSGELREFRNKNYSL